MFWFQVFYFIHFSQCTSSYLAETFHHCAATIWKLPKIKLVLESFTRTASPSPDHFEKTKNQIFGLNCELGAKCRTSSARLLLLTRLASGPVQRDADGGGSCLAGVLWFYWVIVPEGVELGERERDITSVQYNGAHLVGLLWWLSVLSFFFPLFIFLDDFIKPVGCVHNLQECDVDLSWGAGTFVTLKERHSFLIKSTNKKIYKYLTWSIIWQWLDSYSSFVLNYFQPANI